MFCSLLPSATASASADADTDTLQMIPTSSYADADNLQMILPSSNEIFDKEEEDLISTMPFEILWNISQFLSLTDWYNVGCCNRYLRTVFTATDHLFSDGFSDLFPLCNLKLKAWPEFGRLMFRNLQLLTPRDFLQLPGMKMVFVAADHIRSSLNRDRESILKSKSDVIESLRLYSCCSRSCINKESIGAERCLIEALTLSSLAKLNLFDVFPVEILLLHTLFSHDRKHSPLLTNSLLDFFGEKRERNVWGEKSIPPRKNHSQLRCSQTLLTTLIPSPSFSADPASSPPQLLDFDRFLSNEFLSFLQLDSPLSLSPPFYPSAPSPSLSPPSTPASLTSVPFGKGGGGGFMKFYPHEWLEDGTILRVFIRWLTMQISEENSHVVLKILHTFSVHFDPFFSRSMEILKSNAVVLPLHSDADLYPELFTTTKPKRSYRSISPQFDTFYRMIVLFSSSIEFYSFLSLINPKEIVVKYLLPLLENSAPHLELFELIWSVLNSEDFMTAARLSSLQQQHIWKLLFETLLLNRITDYNLVLNFSFDMLQWLCQEKTPIDLDQLWSWISDGVEHFTAVESAADEDFTTNSSLLMMTLHVFYCHATHQKDLNDTQFIISHISDFESDNYLLATTDESILQIIRRFQTEEKQRKDEEIGDLSFFSLSSSSSLSPSFDPKYPKICISSNVDKETLAIDALSRLLQPGLDPDLTRSAILFATDLNFRKVCPFKCKKLVIDRFDELLQGDDEDLERLFSLWKQE